MSRYTLLASASDAFTPFMNMKLRSGLLAALVPACASAHPPPDVTERIDVTGHYEATADAASAGAVTARLIENRPTLRPAEVLEFIPGVMITQHSGDGKANQYFLRGFNLDHGTDFATFVAGMPVNMPSHAHGQGYSDLNFLIPEVVRRIDYAKGPYAAREGDFGSAGTARIAIADRLERGVAGVALGENGYRRAVLAGSPQVGPGTLLAALEMGNNDGPWVNPQRLRRWSGIARYGTGSEEGWSVTAMGYESRWNATDQIPARAVEAGTLDRFDAIDPTDGGESRRYSLSFDLARGPWRLNAYAIRSRLDLFSNFTYFLDDPENGDQFEQYERRTVGGGEASWRGSGTVGGIEVAHLAGVQGRVDRLDPVALYGSVARDRTSVTREDRVRQASAGLYYEASATLNPFLRTIAGIRHDRYDFDVDSSLPENSGTARDAITSPKVSLIVGPWEGNELFANWGRGFHSNDARGTTITVDPKSGEPVDRVTPLVRSTGAELGWRTRALAGWESSLALWQLELDSELLFVGDAGTTEASRPSRRRGFEWNAHYHAGGWLLDLHVARSRARFTDEAPEGDRIPGSVETVASLGITYDAAGPWSGSFHLRHFGPRDLVEDGSARSAATTLAYARVGYRIGEAWRVTLDVFNLFDRKASDIDYYYESRLPVEPAGGVADRHFHPAEPRNFRLALTLRF
jgi:hypothetical protein